MMSSRDPSVANTAGLVDSHVDEEQAAGEAVPAFFVEAAAREPLDAVTGELPVPVVVELLPADADDGDTGRKQSVDVQVVERRQELAVREIAGAAEDDEGDRFGRDGCVSPPASCVAIASISTVMRPLRTAGRLGWRWRPLRRQHAWDARPCSGPSSRDRPIRVAYSLSTGPGPGEITPDSDHASILKSAHPCASGRPFQRSQRFDQQSGLR